MLHPDVTAAAAIAKAVRRRSRAARTSCRTVRVRGRDYPLRSTLSALEPRLDPGRFARVHRSYMVNLDCLLEIQPLESGDARLRMRDGSQVPCSRRYRAALRGRAGDAS